MPFYRSIAATFAIVAVVCLLFIEGKPDTPLEIWASGVGFASSIYGLMYGFMVMASGTHRSRPGR
jgi:hypothetical protein